LTEAVLIPPTIPSSAIFIAPHPDDVAIAAGALAVTLNRSPCLTSLAFVTSGGEARMALSTLRAHGWTGHSVSDDSSDVRGAIRIAEGRKEARILGFPHDHVLVLDRQSWHTNHKTPRRALNADGSIRDVSAYVPGTVTAEALQEIVGILPPAGETWLICPHPSDTQVIHRVVTAMTAAAADIAAPRFPNALFRLVYYEALSTTAFAPMAGHSPLRVAFGASTFAAKARAIRAHESMYERRRAFGGYVNTEPADYDVLAARRCRSLAGLEPCVRGLEFAEQFLISDDTRSLRRTSTQWAASRSV
jgi:LmbE family N-acetylglucosaminyl deacetylase